MKAIAVVPGTNNVNIIDRPAPLISLPDEVIIKIIDVGICGTDREEANGGRAEAPANSKELIIGHEMFGQVIEIGTSVTKVKKGDYAVFTVRRGCGECMPCQNNRSDMCYTGKYTERGIKGRDGFQSEFVIDSDRYLVKVPHEIIDIGVLTEPMSVAVKAVDECIKIQETRFPKGIIEGNWLTGKTAFIAGLGPIGLLAAFYIRLQGAKVIGMDIVDENSVRPNILKQIGGTYLDGRKINTNNIDDYCGQIDLIFDGTGIAQLQFDLIDALGINGIYVLSGIPSGDRPVTMNAANLLSQMVLNNQILIGSVNAGIEHYEKAVQALEESKKKWPEVINSLITSRKSFTEFDNFLHHHSESEIKTVLKWDIYN